MAVKTAASTGVKLQTVISRDILQKYSTSFNESLNLPEGKPFKFLGLVTGEEYPEGVKIGTYGFKPNQVDSPICMIHVEGEDSPREIPFKAITNMVFITKEDVLNEGTVAECVKNLGKRVGEVLLKTGKAEYSFPSEISVVKRFKSGSDWKNIKEDIRANYKLVSESGKTFEEEFSNFEFAPVVFKILAGAPRFVYVYGVRAW